MKTSIKFIYISDQYRTAGKTYVKGTEGHAANDDRGWPEFSKDFKEEFQYSVEAEAYAIRKYTRPTNWYLIDKMDENEYLFNTSSFHYPKVKYEYTDNLPSFSDMMMKRAIEMRDMGKEIDVFYSGGIDSVAILLALNEVCPNDQLRIIMGAYPDPVNECPYIWTHIVKFLPNIVMDKGDLFGQAKIDTNLFTTGCEADQLFGADGYTQITMHAQRDPSPDWGLGYHIDTSKPGNLSDPENREWNDGRREDKVRHLLLNCSFRFLRNLHVDKMDVNNYQPFFLHPMFEKYGINLHLDGKMVYYTPSHLDYHKEQYKKAKMMIRDFIYEKTKNKDYAYGAPKTITSNLVQKQVMSPLPDDYTVLAITEDGTIVTKDNIMEFMGTECLTI